QPIGFKAHGQPFDYADRTERGEFLGLPQLAFSPMPEWRKVGRLRAGVREHARVFTVNDNRGAGFDMYKQRGTLVVPSLAFHDNERLVAIPSGDPDRSGAIGYAKTTDVLLLQLDDIDVVGPGDPPTIVCHDEIMPGGLSALTSFAELVRRASVTYLDV